MESVTATDIALPGLEKAVMTEPVTGHWIERGPQKRLMVFSGRSHPDLAAQIAERLGVELGDVEVDTFANGETYCRYLESIRGADIFLVQTGCQPVDRHLMELMFMIQAAKLASAKRITAVMPLFPYARQDRKARPREPISARLVADMLQLAGADRVLTMDLHAGQIQGFFRIPVDHMTLALPLFARHFRDLGLTGPEIVSVAPDEGRAKMAVRFAEMIEADFAIMHKTRPERDLAEVTEITGKVRDKIAIVGDDVIMTGGTLIANVNVRCQCAGREGRVGVRHARCVLRRRARALPGRTDRRDRRHRHGAGEPARGATEHDHSPGGSTPRRDDHERLCRRLGFRHFRRRKPVVLAVERRAALFVRLKEAYIPRKRADVLHALSRGHDSGRRCRACAERRRARVATRRPQCHRREAGGEHERQSAARVPRSRRLPARARVGRDERPLSEHVRATGEVQARLLGRVELAGLHEHVPAV